MSDGDSSSLSSAPGSDDERIKIAPIFLKARKNAAAVQKKSTQSLPPESPQRPPRSPSPPHEATLADNPDIAFLVMFRSRFSAAFPPKLQHYGPQDIEAGLEGVSVSPHVEDLLCALLGILLNRKKPVERGHHGRALEEAITSQKTQWPRSWDGQNPLSGGRDMNAMTPVQRLELLRILCIWCLSLSETISQIMRDSYKQARHEDDLNQPLSVQPWGVDGLKRRYWLIEGQDDTNFRLYREDRQFPLEPIWWNIAGTIEEVKAVANVLETKDKSQAARRLSSRINSAIPRFEATEEKRRKREYRQIRRAQFARPDPEFSSYEGRTRGKRVRYALEDEDGQSEDRMITSNGYHVDEPTTTSSGRIIRSRHPQLSGSREEFNGNNDMSSRSSRASARNKTYNDETVHDGVLQYDDKDQYNDMDDDDDDERSDGGWNSDRNQDEDDKEIKYDGSNASDDEDDEDDDASLVVKLKLPDLHKFEYAPSHSIATAPENKHDLDMEKGDDNMERSDSQISSNAVEGKDHTSDSEKYQVSQADLTKANHDEKMLAPFLSNDATHINNTALHNEPHDLQMTEGAI